VQPALRRCTVLPAADTVLAADDEVVMTRPVTLSAADCQPLAVPVPIDLGALTYHAGYQRMWHSIQIVDRLLAGTPSYSCYHAPQDAVLLLGVRQSPHKASKSLLDLWAIKICIRAWAIEPQQAA